MKKIIFILGWLVFAVATASSDGIIINSQKMEMDLINKTASYEGQVVAISGKHRIECHKMDVLFGRGDNKNKGNEIKQIMCFGDVIFSGDNKVINSKRAEYTAESRKVYFFDDVKVKDQGSYLEGEKIEYDLKKEVITILGDKSESRNRKERVRIIIEDKQGEVVKSR